MFVLFVSLQTTVDQILAVTVLVEISNFNIAALHAFKESKLMR